MSKKLKLKTKKGDVVDLPLNVVKSVLQKAGFAGKQLTLASMAVVKEAAGIARQGVVSTTDLEKAIVNAVHNTNTQIMNKTKKVVKKVLK